MQSIVQTVYHSAETLLKKPHFHDCHQIILVLKGKVELCVNGKTPSARAGNIVIFSRYENHSIRVLSEEYERYVLHIDPNIVNRKSTVYSLLTDRPVGFCNIMDVSPHMDEMISIFKQISLEHNGKAKFAGEMEQLLVKQLLITICRCTSIDFNNAHDDVVVDLKRQFENKYAEQYNLNILAKQYNISVSALSHRFQTATGVSVMEYNRFCGWHG